NPCSSLADYIRDLQRGQADPQFAVMKTIALLRNEVSKHTVLPVLACNQLIWSSEVDRQTGQPRVRLGDIARGLDKPLRPKEIAAYHEVTDKKPWHDLVQAMLDQKPG